MHLTAQQLEAVQKGEPFRFTAPENGGEFVVLRADVYERMKALVDDQGLEPDQVGRLVEETMREYDENDPLLDSYRE